MKELDKQIETHLKELSMKAVAESYKDTAIKAANSKLTYEEYLAILLESEVNRKKEATIHAKLIKSKFPYLKTIEEFDFSFQPNIKETELVNLCSMDFIEQKNNVIFLGPPGVGKTHLSVALGIKACMNRYRVLFISVKKLIEDLMLAQHDGSLIERLMFFSRLDLLIIDELGYMPISKEQANILFQLISSRYEKGSVILTSNFNFDQWGKVFEDSVVATAIIDRMIHHSKIFYINGSSYRLKDKVKKA